MCLNKSLDNKAGVQKLPLAPDPQRLRVRKGSPCFCRVMKPNIILLLTVTLLWNIHPSITHTAYPIQGRRGLEPITAVIAREAGYILDRPPAYYRADT